MAGCVLSRSAVPLVHWFVRDKSRIVVDSVSLLRTILSIVGLVTMPAKLVSVVVDRVVLTSAAHRNTAEVATTPVLLLRDVCKGYVWSVVPTAIATKENSVVNVAVYAVPETKAVIERYSGKALNRFNFTKPSLILKAIGY
jgi:hypothetical protein